MIKTNNTIENITSAKVAFKHFWVEKSCIWGTGWVSIDELIGILEQELIKLDG